MARPDIIISTLFSSDDVDPATLFDNTALDNFEPDFEDALDALGDPGPLTDALDADPTAILSNRVTWGDATNGAVLTGSGLTQIEDLDALEVALENGIASGAFDTLQIISGGQNILSLQFATNAITLSSGEQSLALRGTLPTQMQDIFDFLENLGNALDEVDLTAAGNFLRNYDLEGLRLTDAGETLFDLTLDNNGLRLAAAGGEFRVDGTVPANNLGTLIDLFEDLIALDDTTEGFNSLDQVSGLAITGITLTAADGTQLIRTSGPLDEVSPLFNNVIIEGTDGDDTRVYLGGVDNESQIIARLGAGDDSVEVYGDDFTDGFIDAPTTVDGGAGFDTVSLLDFSSQQVIVDFLEGTVSGRQLEDQINYSFDITGVEAAEISTFQRTIIFGDDAANTAIAGDVFGRFEFYGGNGTDILDLTQIGLRSFGQDGLRQSDLSNFSAIYHGSNALELTSDDISATLILADVEQVRVKDDAGGTVLVSLNDVLDVQEFGPDFTVGTSEADSLKGDLGADILLGQSGADFIYGDGIQADLTGAVAGQVFRMYQATLARAPDAAGYEGWVTGLFEGTLDLDQMARGFVRSAEFQNTYGSLDDSAFVNLLYQNVLGREGDAGGVQGWLDAISNGTTREGVVLGFSQSAEFQRTTANDAASFALSQSETHWTDEIYRVYRATLDRDPDIGGFLGWAELLGSGTEFDAMIGGFVNSLEFRNTYGSLDDADFVEQLYQNVLDRASDAGGLQGWLDFMEGGGTRAQVVRGFSQSAEFRADTADDLKTWVQAQGRQDVQDVQGPQDKLISGQGEEMDILTGGLLSDVFVFEGNLPARATILDFEPWDVLQLTGYNTNFPAFRNALEQQGADVVFEAQDTQIIFANMQIADFTPDQVEFFAGF
ncbi:DUF4214 domain-containing protein [uncultured Sulfitobacter sp.]|uniref:DUF4214 domain-containing protein n=1 Tax=uncultured Sulfitobacter sp. TaxID=191468 RepID=UPI00261F2649|nr:DUF4214 domain-containing protein [uncultured Sulfitobacter sp.]